jgi:putative heme-binding domain-containing protein
MLLAALLCAGRLAARPQLQTRSGTESESPSAAAGAKIFASRCAGCHGLDGRGGERAPNIVQDRTVQRFTDAELERIIRQGVFGTGMPAFRSLDSADVRAVVTYLRTLQGKGKTVDLPGDPEHGKKLFFGKAGCSACHMMSGEGGFIASDLSGFARTHSAEDIRAAIIKPHPNGDRQALIAVATTRAGEKYSGRVRNEDNFSVQLQTLDGTFHFLLRSQLKSLEYTSQPIMPSDYKSTLNTEELDDIVGYLMKSAGPTELERGVEKDIEHGEEQDTNHEK